MTSRRVITFGSFDPLHAGHAAFFRQAKALGDRLTVVVARDRAIELLKSRRSYQSEQERLQAVAALAEVDESMLGDEDPRSYRLFHQLEFDILALGYDQEPDDDTVRRLLDEAGKSAARFVRLPAFKPEEYKSSFYRP